MIREFTSQDRKLYVEMASEFYHSPAVLHPVPDAFFEGRRMRRSALMPMRRSICLNATGSRRDTA